MKKHLIAGLLIITLPVLGIISCSKSSADQLTTQPPGGTICDTAGMTYTADIVPILNSHCYGCHGAGNTGGSGGISLDGYANLKPYADNGILKGNITHAPGFVGMPYGQPKMDDCTINKILDWISQGSPNN
jgi:hypothetical protein